MAKVQRENFITIQGFMVTDLHLKGNDLLVYAIIYGFSQTTGQLFTGSLSYLAEWTNSTVRGIQKNLATLIERKLIIKHEQYIQGVKFVQYSVSQFTPMEQSSWGMEQSSIPNGKKENSSPHTPYIKENNKENSYLEDKIDDKIDSPHTPQGVGAKSEVEEIVSYLNEKIGTHYKPNTAKTVTLIKARIKEGFTVQDFKTVIDKKIKEWKGTEREQYLRPETLFGTKFEGYLNQKEYETKRYSSKGIEVNEYGIRKDYDEKFLKELDEY